MDLRGHHLLCLIGFREKGYSESFIEKMRVLSPQYKNESLNFDIYINEHTDEICKTCPALNDKKCTSYDEVDNHIRQLDKRILNHLNLEHDTTYSKDYIFAQIKERIEPDDLDILCKGCKWLRQGFCKEEIRKLKSTNNNIKRKKLFL